MQLEEKVDHDPDCRLFKVKSTDPSRPQLVYLCQAEDQADRDRWTGCMRRQLQTQLDFLKALQAPIAYHNSLSKELWVCIYIIVDIQKSVVVAEIGGVIS